MPTSCQAHDMRVVDYEGEGPEDAAFWAAFPETPPTIRAQIDDLRPPRPSSIDPGDPGAMARWAASWRLAAATALHLGPEDDERERRTWTWFASRSLFESDLPLS
jgi:hypothetical protein